MPSRPRGVRTSSAATLLLGLVVLVLIGRWSRQPHPSVGDAVRQRQPHSIERVIDGDTLLLASGQRVRLIGVDTPEAPRSQQPAEPLALEATAYVRSLIGRDPVRLEFDRQRLDCYGRLLAYVWLPDGRLLNAELIRAGFSAAETGFPYRQDMKRQFIDAEAQAREDAVGIWQMQPVSSP